MNPTIDALKAQHEARIKAMEAKAESEQVEALCALSSQLMVLEMQRSLAMLMWELHMEELR